MEWSYQQEQALAAVGKWLLDPGRQVFKLFGYAGTGKTTLAIHLAQQSAGHVLFAAYTGKAASVMREKGCVNATTIHRLIYCPKDKSDRTLKDLQEELKKLLDGSVDENDPDFLQRKNEIEFQIKRETKYLAAPHFLLNDESEIRAAHLVVIDECSMVGEQMGQDLLSFGVKILVLGDPAQLPPVGEGGMFTKGTPDFLLTEVHRQAKDSPIIQMATMVREGRCLRIGNYGDSAVLIKRPSIEELMAASQVIVGLNSTRRGINATCHRQLFGDSLVAKGEKVICLRNNHDIGILNGVLSVVNAVIDEGEEYLLLDIGDGLIPVHRHHFKMIETLMPYWQRKEAEEFDYGYAITCHKSQGSQWSDIIVFDESHYFKQDARKWLYTAITRAEHRVRVVHP